MKKILIILLCISSFVVAQDLGGIKICIDPGHGGHESDDRYIAGPEFWESEGNYSKALHAKEILTSFGAEVILTRNGNGDSGSSDPSLSERAAIANANNADIFHSIHSNATGTSNRTNFVLMLYRGYDDNPVFSEAKELARIMYRHLEKVNHVKNLSWDNIRGDWSFYPSWGTSGLGVLRSLTMPGVLSEGSFHDYLPEAWRLKNDSYLKHEAWAISRSFLEHYGAGNLQTGIIAGILRDNGASVPSSYKPLSELNDHKKPLNFVKVTLMPDSIVYIGDDQNNGYFMFDELEPGEYSLYLEAEDYAKDTVNVTVNANQSVFVNRYLELAPDYSAPVVVSTTPVNGFEFGSLTNEIVVEFDKRMNTSSVESAFSLSPAMLGTFTWEKDSKLMKYKPAASLQPGQLYNATISTNAKSMFDVAFEDEYTFSFTTRSKLNIVETYPKTNELDVSTSTQIIITFDAPIKSSTLGANFSLKDSEGATPTFQPDMSAYSKGQVILNLLNGLKYGETYTLELGAGIGDTEGLTIENPFTLVFTTTSEELLSGNVIDELEDGNWWNPTQSGSTVGVDLDATKFSYSTVNKVNGNKAGRVDYKFTDANGVCRVYNPNKPNIGSNDDSKFGMWIHSDLSNNNLEYWFYHSSNKNSIVEVDTLNWLGWKLKTVNISDIEGSGDRIFHSVVIRKTENGNENGILYFDDIQTEIVTDLEDIYEIPEKFELLQNYPNPFNPSTNIVFRISENTSVSLAIYNLIGEKVKTLVNRENYNSGTYKLNWNSQSDHGDKVPSGVYFYRLETSSGHFAVKKMILLK